MAEDIAKAQAFEYKANSNLVLQADRSLTTRRGDEPTGEVESLAGKINLKEMGSRALRSKPKDLAERVEKEKQRQVTLLFMQILWNFSSFEFILNQF